MIVGHAFEGRDARHQRRRDARFWKSRSFFADARTDFDSDSRSSTRRCNRRLWSASKRAFSRRRSVSPSDGAAASAAPRRAAPLSTTRTPSVRPSYVRARERRGRPPSLLSIRRTPPTHQSGNFRSRDADAPDRTERAARRVRVRLDLLRVGFEGGAASNSCWTHNPRPSPSPVSTLCFRLRGRRRGRHACRVLA